MTSFDGGEGPQERLARLISATSEDMTRFVEERQTILDERSEIQGSAAAFAELWFAYRAEELPRLVLMVAEVTDEALAEFGLVSQQLNMKLRVVDDARLLASNQWASAGGQSQQFGGSPFQGTPDLARPRGRVKRTLLKALHYLLEQVDNVGDSAAKALPVLEPFLELKKILESLIGVSADLSES
jgi:hypothetical protein